MNTRFSRENYGSHKKNPRTGLSAFFKEHRVYLHEDSWNALNI